LESTVNDDEFNTLCEAHSFGAVARGEFPLMPRGLLKALVDAAVAAERERCARKPLTAQQLDKLIEAHVGGSELTDGEYSAMVMFAAAVERAHGIGA